MTKCPIIDSYLLKKDMVYLIGINSEMNILRGETQVATKQSVGYLKLDQLLDGKLIAEVFRNCGQAEFLNQYLKTLLHRLISTSICHFRLLRMV